jgi:hypothetical protein
MKAFMVRKDHKQKFTPSMIGSRGILNFDSNLTLKFELNLIEILICCYVILFFKGIN